MGQLGGVLETRKRRKKKTEDEGESPENFRDDRPVGGAKKARKRTQRQTLRIEDIHWKAILKSEKKTGMDPDSAANGNRRRVRFR